jgi:hypothetical protein
MFTDLEKVIILPPFPVTASRVHDDEIEFLRQTLRLEWNPAAQSFDVVTEEVSEPLRIPKESVRPIVTPELYVPLSGYRIVGWSIVAERMLMHVAFTDSAGNDSVYQSYIYTGGQYWAFNPVNGTWAASPSFFPGTVTQHETLPPPDITPPAGGGPGNQNQN